MSTLTLTTEHPRPAVHRIGARAAWLGFAVVLAAMVMDLLDSTIAQTAAPAIRRDLGGSFASLEWISAAYTLAMSVTLLLGSRLGDILGRRRVLLTGVGAFGAASALCALAPSPGALIAARALQGAIAAIMVPQGFGLTRELFGDEGQQKAFAIVGPVMGLGAVAGPLVGGGLIDLNLFGSGWRAIFLVNVPIAAVAIVAGLRFLPYTPPSTPDARPDVISVALSMVGGFGLVYPLIEGRAHGWPVWSFALIAVGVAAFAAFGWRAGAARPPRPLAAGRSLDPAPAAVRRRAGGRRLLHRRDGRDADRAQRHVPDGSRLQPAGLRHRDGGDPARGDRRLDHLIGAAEPARAHDDAHRRGRDGARARGRRPGPARRPAAASPAGTWPRRWR